MLRIIVGKLWQLLPVLVLVSLASFFLLELVPGDPAAQVLGPDASPAEYAEVRTRLGLDGPPIERYSSWIGNVVTGDLGESVLPPHRTVWELISQRLPVTIEVSLLSMIVSIGIAVPLAMRSVMRPGGLLDRAVTGASFAAISVPAFLAGLLLVFFVVFHPGVVKVVIGALGFAILAGGLRAGFKRMKEAGRRRSEWSMVALKAVLVAALTLAIVVWLPDFPRQGFVRLTDGGVLENLRTVTLPVLTLALTECAVFVRLLRSDLLETLGEDFILSARAKGMPVWRIMVRDALRPSLFSIVTIISVTLGRLIGGSAIVEIIFNLPGMGRLIIESIQVKDYPIVQAAVLMIAVLYVLASAAVDMIYVALDPRIRRGRV